MRRLMRVILVMLLALGPTSAFAGPAEEASATIDRWAAAYTANDIDAIVKLYASDALLHGTSSPTLNAGTAAIHSYFGRLPGSGNKGTFEDAVVRLILCDEVDGYLGSNELSELLDGCHGLARALG